VNPGDAGGGEQCPQCGEGDLRPYGNGSKWVCARCYFILPCCEGGDLAAQAGCVTGAVPEAAAVPSRAAHAGG